MCQGLVSSGGAADTGAGAAPAERALEAAKPAEDPLRGCRPGRGGLEPPQGINGAPVVRSPGMNGVFAGEVKAEVEACPRGSRRLVLEAPSSSSPYATASPTARWLS